MRLCKLSHFSSVSVTLWTVSPPGSSVHGILQARILEWAAIPFSGIFLTRGGTLLSYISCTARQALYH